MGEKCPSLVRKLLFSVCRYRPSKELRDRIYVSKEKQCRFVLSKIVTSVETSTMIRSRVNNLLPEFSLIDLSLV